MTNSLVLKRKINATALAAKQFQVGSEDEPLALLLDLDAVRAKCTALKAAFPKHFQHRFAIKANGYRSFLSILLSQDIGLEAASFAEMMQAVAAGAPSNMIVYDSPLKPRKELLETLKRNIPLNVDNFQELACVATLLERHQLTPTCPIGVRVNPQVGAGSMTAFSTGTATSKFGIGLNDTQDGDSLTAAYQRHPWLTAVHCHVGSQGVGIELAIAGIRATVDFALKVNQDVGKRQIKVIDIGGGLSVNFTSDEISPSFQQYSDALREKIPELFDDTFDNVLTEFGRALVAKEGFLVSRCEYAKSTGGRRIALQYAGADVAVRTVYKPTQWKLRLTLLDGADFSARGGDGVDESFAASLEGGLAETDVAGPCCFQGDIIGHQRQLPLCRSGDLFLVHDVGGYYLSSHSRYNLRPMPIVCGFESDDDGDSLKMTKLARSETIEDVIDTFART